MASSISIINYISYILLSLLLVANSFCHALLPDPGRPNNNHQVDILDDLLDWPVSSHISSSKTAPTNNNLSLANRVAAGYLFAENTDDRLNLSDPIDARLSSILDRDGPDMRSSRDFKDFKDVSVEISKRAWVLLHEHASRAVQDRIRLARPTIEQFLLDAKVSFGCLNSTRAIFDNALKMESWAIKLLNSWGNFPPPGIFDGTYSEMGSYHTCVHIPKNDAIDHAHYCSMSYRPVVPSRKSFELVVNREPKELLNVFEQLKKDQLTMEQLTNSRLNNNRDAFTDILEGAQYHHFVYYKTGTCWPIQCTPFDVRRVAKLIGRRNMLTTGPVKCYSLNKDDYEYPIDSSINQTQLGANNNNNINGNNKKLVISIWDLNNGIFIWKPYFHTTHKVALAIVLSLTAIIILMTGIDIIVNRVPRMIMYVKFALSSVPMENGATSTNINMESRREAKLLQVCKNSHPQVSKLNETPITCPGELSATVDTSLPSATREACLPEEQEVIICKRIPQVGGDSCNRKEVTGFMSYVNDCSILTSCKEFFTVSEGQLKNDILCLNGIRCITMIWIIMTHTMAYNDWSGFARTREIEKALRSLIGQPLFNGSYLVDTFFLMSGLLTAFTAFKQCKGLAERFHSLSYVIGRYLRLTPQILFVNLLYILLPAISDGPHWFPLVGEYSENCVNNWWINLLHIQAFFDTEKMCNFVTWWVSVDFFFHYCGLFIIWIIIWFNHRYGFLAIMGLISSQVAYQSLRHYQKSMPPNILSTIPQMGAMWTDMTLNFFWKPYTHAVPFFFGFYVGYLMAMKQKQLMRFLTPRTVLIGWIAAIGALSIVGFSTYWWVIGVAGYSRWVSTLAYAIYPIAWSASFCWIIIACHHGFGGFLNSFLSMKFWLVLGKASYLVYLSHFQLVFTFLGSCNLLLEPTEFMMFYVILGNIFLSTIYGILLCIIYEHPWLKFHRRIMRKYF